MSRVLLKPWNSADSFANPLATPLVSIAIPTHHPERLSYLKEAVASAQAQTYPSLEIVIQQDIRPEGNLDPTIAAWAQEAAGRDSRIQYRANTQNLGLGGNWNAAVESARGQWVVVMGDDDRLLPSMIETLLVGATPQTAVLFSNHFLINAQGQRLEADSLALSQYYGRDRLARGPLCDPEVWVWKNAVPITSALLRTEVVRRVKFKSDLNNPEIELYVRIAQEGHGFYFSPEYLAEYRVHGNTATAIGLKAEKLAAHLVDIPVSPRIEPYKKAFLGTLLLGAVSRCLQGGDVVKASQWVGHAYYPSLLQSGVTGFLQRVCVRLPASMGVPLYRLSHRMRRFF